MPSVPTLPTIAPLARPPMPTIMPRLMARPVGKRLPIGGAVVPIRLVNFDGRSLGQLRGLMLRGTNSGGLSFSALTGAGFPNLLRPLTIASAAAIGLALGAIRRGRHWAQVAVLNSAGFGFLTFFFFLGYGYLDALHAFVTGVLFQFLLLDV